MVEDTHPTQMSRETQAHATVRLRMPELRPTAPQRAQHRTESTAWCSARLVFPSTQPQNLASRRRRIRLKALTVAPYERGTTLRTTNTKWEKQQYKF